MGEIEVIDGIAPVEDVDELIEDVNAFNDKMEKDSGLSIVGVPLPFQSEFKHGSILGNTGQGKTQEMMNLVRQIRNKGGKAIIYDKQRAYVKSFYDPEKDIILNPLDSRSPKWNIHAEATQATHYDAMAEAIIPDGKNDNPFWTLGARTILSATARRMAQSKRYSTKDLLESLYTTTLEDIASLLVGTEAGSIVDPKNPKTGESIRSILTTYVKSLAYTYDEDVKDKSELFSITDWITDDSREGFIFITTQGRLESTLRPLITTFFNCAITACYELDHNKERALYILIDELQSLNKLPALKSAAAETRQFNVGIWCGWQQYSQIQEIWGDKGAQSLCGLLSTKVQFYPGTEEQEVKHASSQFSTYTIRKPQENLSFGVGPYRDGAGLRYEDKTEKVVSPETLTSLNPLEGFVRIAGGQFPVAPFKIEYVEPPVVASPFESRGLDKLAMGHYLVIDPDTTLDLDNLVEKNRAEMRQKEQEYATASRGNKGQAIHQKTPVDHATNTKTNHLTLVTDEGKSDKEPRKVGESIGQESTQEQRDSFDDIAPVDDTSKLLDVRKIEAEHSDPSSRDDDFNYFDD